MKGIALLGLALALEAAFLFSVSITPTRAQAAGQLAPRRAPSGAERRFVPDASAVVVAVRP